MAFRLDTAFVDRYRSLDPSFGFAPLGEITYLRTYSRVKPDGSKERWIDTVERVVNGTYNMQRRHIQEQGLGWKDAKAQRSAQEMFDLMFHMKFLPPGRGLWAMGSPLTEERNTFAALNNCAFVSTEDLDTLKSPAEPWCFMMDAMMLGIGVGMDVKGAGKRIVQRPLRRFVFLAGGPSQGPVDGGSLDAPKSSFLADAQNGIWEDLTVSYTISDNREGWVESVRMLINSYLLPDRKRPEFVYSLIRPGGLPIKGFGGTSSGPGTLERLHKLIRLVFEGGEIVLVDRNDPEPDWNKKRRIEFTRPSLIGKPITETAIADVGNGIGVCVSGGNVRRSAEILFGPPSSDEFMDLKDYDKHPEREEYGHMSNNSVYAELGMDYSRAAERTAKKGEPGYAWLENMRNFSRMKETERNGKDHRVQGGNPCVSIDTWVLTGEGLRQVKDLIGKPFMAVVDGEEYPSTHKGFWKTGENQQLYLLELDSGIRLEATANHEIKMADGSMKRLDRIKRMDSVRLSNNKKYRWTGGSGDFDTGYNLSRKELMDPEVFIDRSFDFFCGVVTLLFERNGRLEEGPPIGLSFIVYPETAQIVQQYLLACGIESYCSSSTLSVHEYGCMPILVDMIRSTSDDYARLKRVVSSIDPSMFEREELDYVKRITPSQKADVYDCTVPGPHLFSANGVLVSNCLEVSLESYELCCLVETFPFRCVDEKEYNRVLKFAYMYAKTVTLGKTHWPQTNRVLLRNRRIGCSMSGVAQFLGKHGLEELRKWCESGYATIQKYDEIYSDWLCIPRSIKTTSIKPSGTVSLLAGATPGMHYPTSRCYIRRIRLAKGNELIPQLVKAGYHVEDDIVDPSAMVVEMPVSLGDDVRIESEVSMWEQLSLAAFLQRHWADNQVSCTVTFTPDEAPHIKHALELFQYQLKGVSLLPRQGAKSLKQQGMEEMLEWASDRADSWCGSLGDVGGAMEKEGAKWIASMPGNSNGGQNTYPQMPYEEISRERYERLKAGISKVDFYLRSDAVSERFCDGDKCVL